MCTFDREKITVFQNDEFRMSMNLFQKCQSIWSNRFTFVRTLFEIHLQVIYNNWIIFGGKTKFLFQLCAFSDSQGIIREAIENA